MQCLAECVERRLSGRESPSKLLQLMNTFGKNLALFALRWVGPVFRKPRKRFGPIKPLLVHL